MDRLGEENLRVVGRECHTLNILLVGAPKRLFQGLLLPFLFLRTPPLDGGFLWTESNAKTFEKAVGSGDIKFPPFQRLLEGIVVCLLPVDQSAIGGRERNFRVCATNSEGNSLQCVG